MELSVPTNWQEDLLLFLLGSSPGAITEVYGKLYLDAVGGGRVASALSFISKGKAKEHILRLRQKGYKFNYLINASCMDNLEYTRSGQKKLRKLLGWLVGAGVDAVTVSNPYIAMWVKKNYPTLSLVVSTIANVDSLNRAKFWEDLGADKITLHESAVNRNFKLIELICRSIKCKIQLIANDACLINCPTYANHAILSSHASQGWHVCGGYSLDYYNILCRFARISNLVNFIRASWIRPEDLSFYEGLGVNGIKLVDRRLSSNMLIKIIDAYLSRQYQGNLIDLLPSLQGKSYNNHKNWFRKFAVIKSLMSANLFKVLRYSQVLSKVEISINNADLSGFIRNMPEKCDLVSCQECGYCINIASKVVKVDQDYLSKVLNEYSGVLNNLYKTGLSLF